LWATSTAPPKLQQAGEDHLDGLGVGDHAVGDAGQGGDQRWDGDLGVDQGVEGAEHLAAADLDGADLGDAVAGGGAAGGLQVQDHELDVLQWRAEVVQGLLNLSHAREPLSRDTYPLWPIAAVVVTLCRTLVRIKYLASRSIYSSCRRGGCTSCPQRQARALTDELCGSNIGST
jgi:hypothetical protein